jgi:hypothetical protein
MKFACIECGDPIDLADCTEDADAALYHVGCAPWIVDGQAQVIEAALEGGE